MNNEFKKLLLVGDNPFHNISHLSQERARARIDRSASADENANVVLTALDNGANGFMLSVSDTTLAILKKIREKNLAKNVDLYAIVPYAYEYVRIAAQGGTPNLAKKVGKQILMSGNFSAIFSGLDFAVRMKPESLLKTYLSYEISRIRSYSGNGAAPTSILLHEVITDMALALNFDWLFRSYTSFLSKKRIIPGFNTRNFPYLIRKLSEWNINLEEIIVATQFNKAGFQMNPSREEGEKTLLTLSKPIVIGISVLAAGYFKPSEAATYLAGFDNLKGIAVGASNVKQAAETFSFFKKSLNIDH